VDAINNQENRQEPSLGAYRTAKLTPPKTPRVEPVEDHCVAGMVLGVVTCVLFCVLGYVLMIDVHPPH